MFASCASSDNPNATASGHSVPSLTEPYSGVPIAGGIPFGVVHPATTVAKVTPSPLDFLTIHPSCSMFASAQGER